MIVLTRAAGAVLFAATCAVPAMAQTSSPAAVPPRNLILSEAMYTGSPSPMFVELDSGVVYRVTVVGERGYIFIAAQGLSLPPLRFAPISGTQAPGRDFMAPVTGTYRVYAAPPELYMEARGPRTGGQFSVNGAVVGTGAETNSMLQVTIYRDEADNRELRCARGVNRAGCPRRRVGLLLAIVSLPIAYVMLNR